MSIKSDPLKQLDASLGGALGELLAGGDFDGKPGSASKAMRLGGGGAAGPKYVALLGLGKADELGKAEGPQWGASPYQVCVTREARGEGGGEGGQHAGSCSHPGVMGKFCQARLAASTPLLKVTCVCLALLLLVLPLSSPGPMTRLLVLRWPSWQRLRR